MTAKFHAMHGRDHGPRNSDPSRTEEWHVVGDPGEPSLENGWANVGGIYGPTRFRLVVGPPGGDETNEQQSLEIVLAVTGGATGSVVFHLPQGYFDWCQGLAVPGQAHAADGTYRAYHVDGSTGAVTDGV